MKTVLQSVREELVHLGDAGRDAEVNGTVADLDDESANNVRVDLRAVSKPIIVLDRAFQKQTSLVTLSFLP